MCDRGDTSAVSPVTPALTSPEKPLTGKLAHFPDLIDHIPRPRVVELGSRHVCPAQWEPPAQWDRIGIDIISGDGVDLVADVHELSSHLPAASVDAVYCVAVWEHLLMPWKVVLEMNRVMKPGGVAWIVTHKSFPVHDAPWDFYRFSGQAWAALFNPSTGFEVLASDEHSPVRVEPEARSLDAFQSFSGTQAQVRKVGEPAARCVWDVSIRDALPRRHFYPTGPTLADKVAFKLRRGLQHAKRLAGLSRGDPVASREDPWEISRRARHGKWLSIGTPDLRPLEGASDHIAVDPEDRESLRNRLDDMRRRGEQFDGIALRHVLEGDPAPWTLPVMLHALLRPDGVVYLVSAQTPRPTVERGDRWGLSDDALLGLFHPGVGFRVRRRAMCDPCRISGEEMPDAGVARGWLRVLGLAHRVERPADAGGRLSWSHPWWPAA